MGISPIMLEDGRWAAWSSFSGDWATSPGSREEMEKYFLAERILSATHEIRTTMKREAGEMPGPRRFHDPVGPPPEDDDLEDGEDLIPAEIAEALAVVHAWAVRYDDELEAHYAKIQAQK